MARAPNGYYKSVFINAPFTPDRAALFNAMVFTVQAAGFAPRCARELDNAGQVRLDKIKDLIRTCHLGVHDISFMALDGDVPRFNMPFELGLFLGASAFGDGWVARKACTILDAEAFRYQRALSDIAGQDIRTHALDAEQASGQVRNWLSHHSRSKAPILGAVAIRGLYQAFEAELPDLAQANGLIADDLTFSERRYIAGAWLRDRVP